MKKSYSKSLTFALALSMAIILLALPSCRSVSSVQEVRSSEVQKFRSVDTIVMHDSVYRHDSVIYRERTIHDTVFVTKEVYRNQRLSTFDLQHSTKADTVIVTEWRERVVEKPPERYVPTFYKWCTVFLFALLTLMVARWWLKRKWLRVGG